MFLLHGTFLTNYDVKCTKLNMCFYTPLYKNEQKWERNKSTETTSITEKATWCRNIKKVEKIVSDLLTFLFLFTVVDRQ